MIAANDTLDGGTGDDLIEGDRGVVAAPVVATPGVSTKDLKALDREPTDIAWDVVGLGDHDDDHGHGAWSGGNDSDPRGRRD